METSDSTACSSSGRPGPCPLPRRSRWSPPRGTLHGDAPDRVALEGRALGPTARWPLSSQWLQIPKAHPPISPARPDPETQARGPGEPLSSPSAAWPQPPPSPAAQDSFIHNLRQLQSPPHGLCLPLPPCVSQPQTTPWLLSYLILPALVWGMVFFLLNLL